MNRLIYLINALTLSFCVIPTPCSLADDNIPKTSVTVLVDQSASVTHTVEFADALSSIALAIEDNAFTEWEPPVSFFLSWISSSSPFADPPCGKAFLYKPSLGGHNKSGYLSNRKQLHLRLDECVKRITHKPFKPEPFTDISGAIAVSSEIAKDIPQFKTLILLSDFEEDLPPGTQPANFALYNHHIVMIYLPSQSDKPDFNRLMARLKDWEERFLSTGASHVCKAPVKGLLPGTIKKCLQPPKPAGAS